MGTLPLHVKIYVYFRTTEGKSTFERSCVSIDGGRNQLCFLFRRTFRQSNFKGAPWSIGVVPHLYSSAVCLNDVFDNQIIITLKAVHIINIISFQRWYAVTLLAPK